jgi:hypothetical protein
MVTVILDNLTFHYSPANLRTAARVWGDTRKRSAWSWSSSGEITEISPAFLHQ